MEELLRRIVKAINEIVLKAGTAIIGKVGIDQATANANEVVVKSITAGTAILGKVYSDQSAPSATQTRPNDTTAYAAGDVVGTDAATNLSFTSVLSTSGGMFAILSALLRIDAAAIPAGMTQFKLHLFNAAPTAIADNTAFSLADADRAKYLGYLLLDAPTDVGGTLVSKTENINFTAKLAAASTTLYGVCETVGAYTPTASVVKTITLNVMGV